MCRTVSARLRIALSSSVLSVARARHCECKLNQWSSARCDTFTFSLPSWLLPDARPSSESTSLATTLVNIHHVPSRMQWLPSRQKKGPLCSAPYNPRSHSVLCLAVAILWEFHQLLRKREFQWHCKCAAVTTKSWRLNTLCCRLPFAHHIVRPLLPPVSENSAIVIKVPESSAHPLTIIDEPSKVEPNSSFVR